MRFRPAATALIIGGVLALAAPSAQAADTSRTRESTVRTVTPETCEVSYSPFIQRAVTQCHSGWSVVKTSRAKGSLKTVRTRSQSTTTADAIEPPAYSFKDVDDIWDRKVYRGEELVYERQTIQVTYTIQGSTCVRRWTGVTEDGLSTTVEWSDDCPASAAPVALS